jgi:enterochelin esterase-like enzyme
MFAQDPDFHIYLCFGQSNMEGFPGIPEEEKTGVEDRFQMLAAVGFENPKRDQGKWYTAIPPLSRPRAGMSPADYFGRTLAAHLPEKFKIGVINVAVGGCKIELFEKNTYESYVQTASDWMQRAIAAYGGNPYGRLIELAQQAQKQGVIKGVLLHQGESNTNDEQWPDKVKGVYENLLSDLNLKADAVPLLAGELVHEDQQGRCASMNAIIGKLPTIIPTAHVISSAGCEAGRDRLHFTPDGYRELGRRYADKMLQLLGYPPAEREASTVKNKTTGVSTSHAQPADARNIGHASQVKDPIRSSGSAGQPRRGGGLPRFRGAPLSAEESAAIAMLGELPAWNRSQTSGDFSLAPPFAPAPENDRHDGVPTGRVETFYIDLEGSRFFPPGGRGDGDNAVRREINVYIPAQYVPGTPAPLLFCHDAMGMHDNQPAPYLPAILDNMIHEKRLPVMVAVMVMPSNQRSLEYDTVSGKFAEFVEAEVLPVVESKFSINFTKDPNARATLGGSSGGAAALSMAWFHPELYRRVLVFSGTFVNLRNDPKNAPHGAWEYHENFIPNTTPNKPLRIWLEVGEKDNGSQFSGESMRNWVLANMRMAEVLKAKRYAYQFVYAKEAGHVDRPVRAHTLAPALEWLWQDYRSVAK